MMRRLFGGPTEGDADDPELTRVKMRLKLSAVDPAEEAEAEAALWVVADCNRSPSSDSLRMVIAEIAPIILTWMLFPTCARWLAG
eukprot:597970-Pyramimonas_sp.AAC.1